MKVKTLLDLSACTKVHIHTPDFEKEYILDYLAVTGSRESYNMTFCSSRNYIPEEVLNLKIDIFSASNNSLIIWTKGKKNNGN